MTEHSLQASDVNKVWSDAMRSIRHAQLNELQLIRSYSKMQHSEKMERCVAFMLEKLDQERMIQSYGDPVWLARLLPLVYGVGRIRVRFEQLIYQLSSASLEQDWQCSLWVEQALYEIIDRFNLLTGAGVSPEPQVLRVSIHTLDTLTEIRMKPWKSEGFDQLLEFAQTISGNPEITDNQEHGTVIVRWSWR